jgi:uncharacterized protein YcnI
MLRGEVFMRRTITIAVLACAMTLATASAAMAHVTAQPRQQPADGYTKVTFRVPNERPAPTVSLKVSFPDLASVSVLPVPGWSYKVTKRKPNQPVDSNGEKVTEVVDTVTWSGGKVLPGEFVEFPVSVKLPAKGEVGNLMFFPAIQTYQGGEQVKWIEKPASADSKEELENPAPTIELVSQDQPAAGSSGSGPNDLGRYATRDHVDDVLMPWKLVAGLALLLSLIALALAVRKGGANK